MINADNADKNRVFPFSSLPINADKRRQHCLRGKRPIHAGFSLNEDRRGGASVFYREYKKKYIYIIVSVNTLSPYPCGFQPQTHPVCAVSVNQNHGGRGSNAV
jgi:hypothetical protein